MTALNGSSDVAAGIASGSEPLPPDTDRTVVWLDGDHDIATLSLLADLLDAAMRADDRDIVVDLSGVTFLSAGTVGGLVEFRSALARQSRNLLLRSPSRPARRVLDLCGLAGLLEAASAWPGGPDEGRRELTEARALRR